MLKPVLLTPCGSIRPEEARRIEAQLLHQLSSQGFVLQRDWTLVAELDPALTTLSVTAKNLITYERADLNDPRVWVRPRTFRITEIA